MVPGAERPVPGLIRFGTAHVFLGMELIHVLCVQAKRGDDHKEGAPPDLLLLHLRVRPSSIPLLVVSSVSVSTSSVTAHSVEALREGISTCIAAVWCGLARLGSLGAEIK